MIMKCLASGSRGNCYLLTSTEGETLIIECGVDIKEIKKGLNFNFSKVAGVIITHEHKDHSKEAKALMSLGVKVFMSFGTMEALKLPTMINNSLGNGRVRKVGSFEIFSFDVRHDAREPLGFLITHDECGTIFFATDTHYIPWSFKGFKINHVMIECNYSKEILRYNNQLEKLKDRIIHSHFELEDVKNSSGRITLTELKMSYCCI